MCSKANYDAFRVAHTHADRLFAAVAQGGGCHHMFDPAWINAQDQMEYPFALAEALAYKFGFRDADAGAAVARYAVEGSKFSLLEAGIVGLTTCKLLAINGGSVADIEALLCRDGKPMLGFPAEAQQFLQQLTGQPQAQFSIFIERARLAAILDEIRNQVLHWAIALDKAGVKGEGLSFSSIEKERAHSIMVQQTGGHLTIGFVGNVCDHANVAAGIYPHAGSINAGELLQLLAELRAHVSSVTLTDADSDALQAAMAELDATDPAKSVEAGKVRKVLGRVLGCIGSAGQTVMTAGLKAYTEQWMKQHGLSP